MERPDEEDQFYDDDHFDEDNSRPTTRAGVISSFLGIMIEARREMALIRPAYIDATRSTFCDVVSIVTTIGVIKNGTLKYVNADVVKGAQKTRKITPANGLYGEGVAQMSRELLHERLLQERHVFMSRLGSQRAEHVRVLQSQAVRIQSAYRGYLARRQWESVRRRLLVRKDLRALVKGKHHKRLVTSHKRWLNRSRLARDRSVNVIQHAFRLFREKQLAHIKQKQLNVLLGQMATKIQSLRRRSVARARAASIVYDKYFLRHTMLQQMGPFHLSVIYRTSTKALNIAATVIQRMYRSSVQRSSEELLRARAKEFYLRNTSARCIQAVFRGCKIRKHFFRMHALMVRLQCLARCHLARRRLSRVRTEKLERRVRSNLCATVIQKMVRARLVRNKVQVLRQRLRMYKYFDGASKMQSSIRGFLARRLCARKQAVRRERQAAAAAQQREAAAAAEAQAVLAAERAELMAADIFYQTSIGAAAVVDRLFNDVGGSSSRVGAVGSGAGHSVQEVNEDNETVLLVAAKHGYLSIVQRCVWWGFSLSHRNKDEDTAIMLAIKNGHEEVVHFLLDLPATETQRDKFKPKTGMIKPQDTAIMTTAVTRSGHTSLLRRLCEFGVNADARLPASGETALQIACELNNLEAIRYLMTQRCNILAADERGKSALMKAVASSPQAARILLGLSEESHVLLKKLGHEASEAVAVRDAEGKDCYTHAALNGHADTLEMFVSLVVPASAASGPDPVFSGSGEEDPPGPSQQLLLSAGSPAAYVGPLREEVTMGKPKRTVHWLQSDVLKIFRLIERGESACLNWLLDENNLNPNMMHESTGVTMAMCAAEHGQQEVLHTLMSRSINMSVLDAGGRNCLHYAARCAIPGRNMVAYMLQHPMAGKCRVSPLMLTAVDARGDCPLHEAARSGTLVPEEALTADSWRECLCVANRQGKTPLLEACEHQHADLVLHYLARGAAIDVRDAEGRDCLWHLLHPHSPLENGDSHTSKRGGVLERRDHRTFGKVALMLLRGGCVLYNDHSEQQPSNSRGSEAEGDDDPESFLAAVRGGAREGGAAGQAGDFAVQALDSTTLHELRDMYRGTRDVLWRLVRSCLLYDKSSSYALRAFVDKNSVAFLGSAFYGGYSLLGWAVVLDNVSAAEFLLEHFGAMDPVDRLDNTCLHLAARHDHADMVHALVGRGRIRPRAVETRNALGYTAAMEGAKHGSFHAVKVLHKRYRASARIALDGKYWAWLLALAIKEVKHRRQSFVSNSNAASVKQLIPPGSRK